eukprot:5677191-Amphidinium_carterae.1
MDLSPFYSVKPVDEEAYMTKICLERRPVDKCFMSAREVYLCNGVRAFKSADTVSAESEVFIESTALVARVQVVLTTMSTQTQT